MDRLERILARADILGMIPIVQLFYFGQVFKYNYNDSVILKSVENLMDWLLDSNYRGIIIELVNECDIDTAENYNQPGYAGTILEPEQIADLIAHVKNYTNDEFIVGTSYKGAAIPDNDVVEVSDLVFLHGNSVEDPAFITEMIRIVRDMDEFKANPKPIIFNEVRVCFDVILYVFAKFVCC